MKKFKWTILSIAVILAVCGAFVTRPHFDCSTATQYFYSGGSYLVAGEEGVDYTCTNGSGTCTYYTTNGVTFFPCQAGLYCTQNCFIREKDKTGKPSKPATTPANPQLSH